VNQDFSFKASWALKESMKFGNLKAADYYSSKDMYADLENLAKNGELLFEEIPIIKTIKEWIRRYIANFKKE
ncbi:8718_t:CDS:2, partial [Scutellospora calospora]